ncbi:MAG: 3-oxoacyl-ACP reductase family protein [Gemmatimonadota bacterium]|nr:3-oxoacyl-ACP reductase family protein [Gemmatimonadota bacterium]
MSLDGKGAVVTGGGRGIGAAVARSLAEAGARVVVAARSSGEIEAVATALRSGGVDAWAVPVDVSEPDSIAGLFERAREHLGTVDILVNNAGIALASPAVRLSLADWNRLIAVNATGTFLCTQAVLGPMIDRGWGRIVNVASIAGLKGAAYISGYSASKHAVIGLTRSVAVEVARAGVTVNAVCPGYVDTPMTEASIANIVEKTGMTRQDALGALLDTTPQRRLITSGEVAAAVMFLLGEEARGINGQSIVIDGGAIGGMR